MVDAMPLLLKAITCIGCALVGGGFFAFSSFVMRALAKIPPAQGVAAMQSINLVVINVSFMALLFGTAALCLVEGVWALLRWDRPGSGWAVAGAAIYLVGTIGTTLAFNVPRNDALAVVDPATEAAARVWERYVVEWTMWNTVRTLAAVAAAVMLLIALAKGIRTPVSTVSGG